MNREAGTRVPSGIDPMPEENDTPQPRCITHVEIWTETQIKYKF